jgi:hypothetical protein
VRETLGDARVVLGGFRTVIADRGRRLRFMTAHQLAKTWYLVALLRPLTLLRRAAAHTDVHSLGQASGRRGAGRGAAACLQCLPASRLAGHVLAAGMPFAGPR